MKRPTRRAGIAGALVVAGCVALAAAAWWFDARTSPEAVATRLAALIVERHAGASVAPLDRDALRVTMPSGLYVDARLASVFRECRDDRFDCANAIDRVATDVEHAAAMAAKPRLADLRATVAGDASPGFRLGYVTEPLIGPLEVRYALVAGAASTFVTSTIADRLGVDRSQLKRVSLENLAADGEPRVESIGDRRGVYRVVAQHDAAANLLDAGRMRKLAALVGSDRMYCALPQRGTLFLSRADRAGKEALAALIENASVKVAFRAPGVFVYDTTAPEGRALSATDRQA